LSSQTKLLISLALSTLFQSNSFLVTFPALALVAVGIVARWGKTILNFISIVTVFIHYFYFLGPVGKNLTSQAKLST